MSTNDLLLDFTSPGAIPPDPSEVVQRVIDETQTTMRTLELLLESERVEEVAGWKLLAMFYLATDRINDLAKIEKEYKSITGTSLSADFRKKYPQWFNGEVSVSPVIFEIPKKFTAAALPDSAIIWRGQNSSSSVVLDFSQVEEIDNDGLKELAHLFSYVIQENTRLELKQADRFITCLQNKAETGIGSRAIWDVLFAYERFRGNRGAFEEKAIKFAVLYGISPPSWE